MTPATDGKRNLRIWALGGLFTVLLMATGTALVGWARATPSAAEPLPRPLTVATLAVEESPSYTTRRELVGRVEARRRSQLGFELPGRVIRIEVEEGDRIAAGSTLARLDTERLEARREELRADLARAEADLELARRTLERVIEASELDAISTQARDEAELGVRAREAAAQRARAGLEAIEVDLGKSLLRAPFDAVVVHRAIDEGTVLSTGTTVVELLESRAPEARIAVAGPLVDHLEVGQTHRLRIGGLSSEATVRALLPIREKTTRTVDAIFRLDTELGAVRPGDLARLDLERRLDTAGFWVPMTALTESARGLWAVYVAEDAGKGEATLARRQLEILHQEADRVFVRGALRDGDRVVVSGLHRLTPGQRVVPADA